MKIIQQVYKVDNDKYYELHLNIINAILPVKLTDKELEVLASFMALDEVLTKDDYFNPVARKKVREKTGVSPGGLSNHLKSMIKKGFLVKNDITKKITIKEFLLPEEKVQGYQFKIMKNETGE